MVLETVFAPSPFCILFSERTYFFRLGGCCGSRARLP